MSRKVNVANVKKAKADAKSRASSGNIFKIKMAEEGEYILYIAYPCREDYDQPCVERTMHFSLGSKGDEMALCLSARRNPVLEDDRLHAFLPDGQAPDNDDCSACDHVFAEYKEHKSDKRRANDIKKRMPKPGFLYNVVLIGSRKEGQEEFTWVDKDKLVRQVYPAGSTVFNGISQAFLDYGDVSDVDAAKLIRIKKTGTKFNEIEYRVDICPPSIFEGNYRVGKALRAKLEEDLVEGGEGDLFKVIARDYKTFEDLLAMAEGISIDEEDDDDDDEDTKKRPTSKRPETKPAKASGPAQDDEDEDTKDDDSVVEEEEETPPPKKAAPKAAPAKAPAKGPPVDDDEEELVEEEEEDIVEAEEASEAVESDVDKMEAELLSRVKDSNKRKAKK